LGRHVLAFQEPGAGNYFPFNLEHGDICRFPDVVIRWIVVMVWMVMIVEKGSMEEGRPLR
jgi:hypothetical protein